MGTREKANTKIHIENLSSVEKARVLLRAGVKTIICGCISESLQKKLERSGINVIWGITGPIMKVVEAFQAGQLESSPYRVLSQKVKRIRTRDFFLSAR
jgi:predicted Fe-Mo cluster-binding NifX family protein